LGSVASTNSKPRWGRRKFSETTPTNNLHNSQNLVSISGKWQLEHSRK
jgi:hypothetical protein